MKDLMKNSLDCLQNILSEISWLKIFETADLNWLFNHRLACKFHFCRLFLNKKNGNKRNSQFVTLIFIRTSSFVDHFLRRQMVLSVLSVCLPSMRNHLTAANAIPLAMHRFEKSCVKKIIAMSSCLRLNVFTVKYAPYVTMSTLRRANKLNLYLARNKWVSSKYSHFQVQDGF